MRKTDAFRRAAALMAALSITVSLAAPAFAGTYYIDDGDITITKNEDGSQTIEQGGDKWTDKAGEETVITTSNTVITTLESDLEGPAAEDSDFGPVVEDNYQPAAPAQPEDADQQESADRQKDADQQEDADQQKDADQQESADQQAQPLQAAPAPAASTPDFWHNTITVINIFTDTVLNLTLKNVKIDVSDADGKAALSVQGDGNVTIELDGKKVTLAEALGTRQFSKVYILLGINEIGAYTAADWAAQYKSLLDLVREKQPDAVIFIQSIFHTTQKKSDSSYFKNEVINERNAAKSQSDIDKWLTGLGY